MLKEIIEVVGLHVDEKLGNAGFLQLDEQRLPVAVIRSTSELSDRDFHLIHVRRQAKKILQVDQI